MEGDERRREGARKDVKERKRRDRSMDCFVIYLDGVNGSLRTQRPDTNITDAETLTLREKGRDTLNSCVRKEEEDEDRVECFVIIDEKKDWTKHTHLFITIRSTLQLLSCLGPPTLTSSFSHLSLALSPSLSSLTIL